MPTEIRVPDIGDFRDVKVAEVLIAPGGTVSKDAPVIVLETDKATLEVPASANGTIAAVSVKVGDVVSQGSLIASLAADTQAFVPAAAPGTNPPEVSRLEPAPSDAISRCALVVIGGGPGGYSAAFRAADLGLDVVLLERRDTLGGVCLNVGCIPSKALLHLTGVMDEAEAAAAHGVTFGPPQLDLDRLRAWKDGVVNTLTTGLAGLARSRKVRVVTGTARFTGPNTLAIQAESAPDRILRFEQCILAAGSRPIRLSFLPEDPRVVDSTGALALAAVPQRMLVIGGGIVGLEMATVYASLGATVDVVERLEQLMPGADRDLVTVWSEANLGRFRRVMVSTRAVSAESRPDGIWVAFDGPNAPAEPVGYDLVLEAVGRTGNGDRLDLERIGIAVNRDGTVHVDAQRRTSVPHIFAVGDIAGSPMLAHKAVHEGHVAAECAAGRRAEFEPAAIPSVAYTRPELAWVGLTEAEAAAVGRKPRISRFPWPASGRALASHAAAGLTKLLFDEDTGRVVGGGIVGLNAGELVAEVGLAIELGADAVDLGRTIHAHPTLSETIGLAAEVAEGTCTDLPSSRKREVAPLVPT